MARFRPIRYSIRTLLCITLLISVTLAWFSHAYLKRYRRDAALIEEVAAIERGKVYSSIREPEWLWTQFGDKIARRGTSLILSDSDVSDSQITQLERLHDLGGLYLDRTAVTNRGLTCLSGLPELVALSLRRTNVSELPSLSHMRRLVSLDLSFTNVSKVNLEGLDSLQTLCLRATRLSDESLENFPPLPELKSLDIAGSFGKPMLISDQGIKQITPRKSPKLKIIYLYFCDVSDSEVERLQSEFPGIRLCR